MSQLVSTKFSLFDLFSNHNYVRESEKWDIFSGCFFPGFSLLLFFREFTVRIWIERRDSIELSIIECVRDRNRMEGRGRRQEQRAGSLSLS